MRLAVLGAGVMGSYHARVIARSERCDLVSVVDPSAEAGRPLADRYGAAWQPDPDGFAGLDAVVDHFFNHGYDISANVSLFVVIGVLAIGIVASFLFPEKDSKEGQH